MNEFQWTNETHFFIRIYLSHFILERGTQFFVSLRDRWRDIYSERWLLLAPYLFSWRQWVATLAPPCNPYRQRNLWLAAYPWLDRPTPTHCYPPCLLITTWQLVKPHGVTRNEPKIYVNCHYITQRLCF